MTSALLISVVKRLKSPSVLIFTFLTPGKNAIKTQPISSHHDQTNEVSYEIVLRPHNHIKESQHEFNSSSHGFSCFDFPRLLLQAYLISSGIKAEDLQRKQPSQTFRAKKLKKKFRQCSLHDYFLSHPLSSPCCCLMDFTVIQLKTKSKTTYWTPDPRRVSYCTLNFKSSVWGCQVGALPSNTKELVPWLV